MEKADEILEIVSFLKDRMATKEDIGELAGRMDSMDERMATKEDLAELKAELKRDIHGLGNQLDNELDKRKALEVRVDTLERNNV